MHGVPVPWTVVMNYEMEIRKKAFELVREEGFTLKRALQAAMTHEETRSLHFTIHLTLGGRRQGREDPGRKTGKGEGDDKKKKGGKDKGKGVIKDKVKTKGGGKGNGRQRASMKGGLTVVGSTSDNRLICYAYNDGRTATAPVGCFTFAV